MPVLRFCILIMIAMWLIVLLARGCVWLQQPILPLKRYRFSL